MKRKHGGDSEDWIFLAMAHWKLGQKTEARRYYDRAVQRMPIQASLQRFRAEAAALLGIGGEQEDRKGPKASVKP